MNPSASNRSFSIVAVRSLVLALALQLAYGSVSLAAYAQSGSPAQMLTNETLPLATFSRQEVETAMKAATAQASPPAQEAVAPAVGEPEAQAAGTTSDTTTEAPAPDAPKVSEEIQASAPEEAKEGDVAQAGTTSADVSNAEGSAIAPSEKLAINYGPGSLFYDGKTQAPKLLDGVVVIDNDEAVETETTIEYQDLPTDTEKTKVKTGARFPVVMMSEITSKTAKQGDPIRARLKYDLKIADRLVAEKGAMVTGHLNYVLKARTILHSLVSPERWYRNSGCIGISFDEIVNAKNEHIPLVATPARKSRIVKNKGEGRVLGVNHHGQITGPWAQQLRYKAIRVGLNFALAPAGVFSFGAMPVALGVIGAVNPSFAFSKPVGLNVRHRRIKGFAWGFLSGIPGSFLIEDTVVKGQEAVIKPGDEFLAEIRQEFTGEPETEANLMPGASTKVRGQVMDDGKAKPKVKTKKR